MNNVNDKNPRGWRGFTPVALAANNGHLDICNLIIDNVKDWNKANDSGLTPLHIASKNGHIDICRMMIAKVTDRSGHYNHRCTFISSPLTDL